MPERVVLIMMSDLTNNIVIPTGYMGSGSSAVTDILSEIEGYSENNGSYEYVFLHCPNGVFDLEDKLLVGNTTLRSDEAIHSFKNCMIELYNRKNYWISGYKYKISEEFLDFCNEFLDDIGMLYLKDAYWYYQQNPRGIKMHLKILYSKFYNRIPILKNEKVPLTYKDVYMAYPSEEQFYSAAKTFLNKIFVALGIYEHNLVLDQLILPQNISRLENYFSDNIKVIIVDRDPRDVFLLNKYVWKKRRQAVPYPYDVQVFCDMYSKMREIDAKTYSDKVLRIHFEDLVYNYEDTLNLLYDFLNINSDMHRVNKCKIFNPSMSQKNTQIYKINTCLKKEAEIIEKRLSKYIYNFEDKPSGNEQQDFKYIF